MEEIRFVAAGGALGAGIDEVALTEAMTGRPHFIACDAGTTDAGPYYLGSGQAAFARESVRADLRTMLTASTRANIPAIIGSAGTAGGDVHVDWTLDIIKELVEELGVSIRVAVIYSEQSKDFIAELLEEDRIVALDAAPKIDVETVRRSTRIVGMMGVEPIQRALSQGVDVVLAGRCSDSALFAAMPIQMGFPEGLSWHAGKVMECGTLAAERPGPGVLFGTITRDEVTVRGIGRDVRCTPSSIAAHSLYENGDPFLFVESSGVFDLTKSTYAAVDERTVRIRGTGFHPAETYTVKLEGATLAGYSSLTIGGIRDPFIIRQLDDWLERVEMRIHESVRELLNGVLEREEYKLAFHLYGKNGVMGSFEPPAEQLPIEIGLVVEVLAPTQEIANTIAKLCRQPLLHTSIPEWIGGVTTFACLHNPSHIERGPVYEFFLNHAAIQDHEGEFFRHEYVELAPRELLASTLGD